MEHIREWTRTHKREISGGILVILIIIIILMVLLRSCQAKNVTDDPAAYITHVGAVLGENMETTDRLIDYLDEIGTRLIECDEDVAKQLGHFSEKYAILATQYHRLTYIGKTPIVGIDVYHEKAALYAKIGTYLDTLKHAIQTKNTQQINTTFDLLQRDLTYLEELKKPNE